MDVVHSWFKPFVFNCKKSLSEEIANLGLPFKASKKHRNAKYQMISGLGF